MIDFLVVNLHIVFYIHFTCNMHGFETFACMLHVECNMPVMCMLYILTYALFDEHACTYQ